MSTCTGYCWRVFVRILIVNDDFQCEKTFISNSRLRYVDFKSIQTDDCKPNHSSLWSVESKEIICFSSTLVNLPLLLLLEDVDNIWLKNEEWEMCTCSKKLYSWFALVLTDQINMFMLNCFLVWYIIQKKCHYFGRKFTYILRTDENYIVVGKMQCN